jgi:AcrR family transcriptional regulator
VAVPGEHRYGPAMNEKNSRQAIIDCALDLLVRHGYRGASFGDIAAVLGMTRANIHYHFGSKQALVEAVLADYVSATLAALRDIWQDRNLGFPERVEQMLSFSLKRYRRYNQTGAPPGPWSLISRLRQDANLLTPDGREMLSRFSRELRVLFAGALSADVESGRLAPDTPVTAVAAQFALIADNASSITLDPDGAAHLAELYRGLVEVVEHGYGVKPSRT